MCSTPRDSPPPREHELPHHCGLLRDEGALIAVGAGDFRQNLLEPPSRHRIIGREIGATEEGGAVGGQEDGERPAMQTGQALDRRLITQRDIGPLVAVHANRNKERIDRRADLGVGVDRAVGFGAPAAYVAADV